MILKKRIYGKWVLSGEHSVLRSKPAIAFPFSHYFIDFSYKEASTPLNIIYKQQGKSSVKFYFLPLFEQALKVIGKQSEDLKGVITIDSHIPFGVGLGTSAILAVACALCFEHKKWISKEEIKTVAKKLEDLSHKKSSGMDVTVVLEQKPMLFQNGKVKQYLDPFKITPQLYLSYCGCRSSTFFAISKVKELFSKRKKDLEDIDSNMEQSVDLCLQAMQSQDKNTMDKQLQQALNLGEQSFKDLGLMSKELERHAQKLKQAGALATKPTGSGLGGYVISLWDKEPSKDIGIQLIKAFDKDIS